MSKVFGGSVLLPGEEGPGLDAAFEMSDDTVRLLAGSEELGTWEQAEFDVSPSGKGAFRIGLGSEEVFFAPASPSTFAEAMHVPLQPEATEDSGRKTPTYDIDAAIDEAIANVKPLRDVSDEDDILSKPLLATIVAVSGALMAGLVGMTFML